MQGITVTEVKGFGRQKGHIELYRDVEYVVEFVPKVKIEIATRTDKVDRIIDTLCQSVRTRKIGDGKIFFSELQQAIRIRTAEKDHVAL